MKVAGPKVELYADHSSDMSTGITKYSAQKSSARKSKKLRDMAAFWDNDFRRESKSKAQKNLNDLFSGRKVYEGGSLIRL